MHQSGGRARLADHRLVVRQITFGAAPRANHADTFQRRHQLCSALHHQRRALSRALVAILGMPVVTRAADNAMPLRRLSRIDAVAFGGDTRIHERIQWLGHGHDRMARRQRHLLAETYRDRVRPRARTVEQILRANFDTGVRRRDHKLGAVEQHLVDPRPLTEHRTGGRCRARERLRHRLRIGMTVIATQRSADHARPQPRILRAQLLLAQQMQIQVVTRTFAIRLDRRQLDLVPREL